MGKRLKSSYGTVIRPGQHFIIYEEGTMEVSKALAVMDQAKKSGALIFARRDEIMDVSEQYEPLTTIISFNPVDFAEVGRGNNYPMKAAQHQIADAVGVSFLPAKSKTWTEGDFDNLLDTLYQFEGVWQVKGNYSVKSSAVAIRRAPDGTMRESSGAAYEFNVADRFNEDRMNDQAQYRPKSIMDARKKLLQVKKFSTRRAATGAELASIREIAGIPTAFKKEDLKKDMCFSQTVESQKYKNKLIGLAMQTPEGQAQVLNKALGITENLYGRKGSQSNPKPAELAGDVSAVVSEQSDDSIPGFEEPEMEIEDESLQAEQRDLRRKLSDWEASDSVVYLNDKVGKLGDPNKENLAKIRSVLEQSPIDVGKANLLLNGLAKVYNK